MSQSFDEQLKRTLDSISERMQSNLTDHVTAAVEQLTSAAASDRQAAATEAAASTEKEVTARLTESFTAREARLKETARAEWFQAGLQQAQAEAQALHETHQTAARAALDAAHQATGRAEAQALALQQERDRHVRAALETASQTAAHIQAVRIEATVESEVRLQTLLESLRSIDTAPSLTHTLDALVAAAKPQADRLALFLLRGDTLRAWSHFGFDAMHDFGAPTEFALAHAGLLADAVRSCTPQSIVGADGRRPTFAGAAAQSGTLVAVPLMMNGQPIGVLCGEHLSAVDSGRYLLAVYDVLARHAACVLESLTALRLANVSAHTAVAAPHH